MSADYILSNSNVDVPPDVEERSLLNHILFSEDLKSEEQLSKKSKNALTVKKITNKLLQRTQIIKYVLEHLTIREGTLTKQGEKANKKVEERYVRLTPTEVQWFHKASEAARGVVPLGCIYLHAIYRITPVNL